MKKLLLSVILLAAIPMALLAQGSSWRAATLVTDGTTVSGSLDDTNNDNWYKVVLTSEGNVTFDARSDANLVIRYISINILNSKGDDIHEKDWIYLYNEEKPYTVEGLKPGTYYIRLHRERGGGSYTMKYTFTAPIYKNDPEPNDKWQEAAKLENGQTAQGRLGYWGLETGTTDMDDWYRIDVPDDGSITLDVHTENTLTIRYVSLNPVNGDGSDVHERGYQYLWRVEDEKPYTITDIAPGTYYVRLHLETGHGCYTLKYTFTPNRYRGDVEPNDSYENAIEIKDGETKTGHLGYKYNDSYTDIDDWYKVDVQSGVVKFTIEADTTTSLVIRFIELFKHTNGRLSSMGYIYVYSEPDKPGEFTVSNLDDGTYYLQVRRERGEGGYSLTCGSPQRSADSKIRVHYIGQNSTRLGIPSPFQVKIENIDSHPSGSFFLIIPASDDVKLLYAECPCDTGVVRYNMADLGGEENNSATFIVPGLDPYESYTFTMYAEGRVDNKNARSGRRPVFLTGTVIAVAAYVGTIAVSMATDKVTEYLTNKVNKKIMPEEDLKHYARTYSLSMDQLKEDKKKYNIGAHAIQTMAKKAGENIVKAVPGGAPVATTMGVVENVNSVVPSLRRKFFWSFGRAKAIEDALAEDEPVQTLDVKVGATRKVSSWDPNEMCGPAGYGDEGYISETKTMDYRILFENKKEATAPAYRIRISDVLDERVFDVSSVRFGSTSHEGTSYNWKMNRDGNKLTWDIEGIELPPNVNAPEGEGYVTFSVNLKPNLKSGTQIKNKATIIFDYNEPIETNEYLNTLDLAAPTGRVQAVALNDNKFTVSCSGEDAESGICFYKYYYSVGGNDFQFYAESNSPEFIIPVEQGRSARDYTFCVVAVDNVGNTQLALSEPWAVSTAISAPQASPADDSWTISSLNGTTVASGKGTPSARLTKGVYVTRQGDKARKVIIR